MNKIIRNIFRYKEVNFEKLSAYGFIEQDKIFIYKNNICGGQMQMTVTVSADGNVNATVYDLSVQDFYTLFLAENATGSFVGGVKAEYEDILSDISEKCFVTKIFNSDYAVLLIKHVKEIYNAELEYLWEKSPKNAVWRRGDNRKWFGAILTVSSRKLGFDSDEVIEILDMRADPSFIEKAVDGKRYFNGYHMNKKHWITVCLDGSVDISEIYAHLADSYKLALN